MIDAQTLAIAAIIYLATGILGVAFVALVVMRDDPPLIEASAGLLVNAAVIAIAIVLMPPIMLAAPFIMLAAALLPDRPRPSPGRQRVPLHAAGHCFTCSLRQRRHATMPDAAVVVPAFLRRQI